ncbi:MAG: glycoside hydrolase family 92 protein, partial [Muribaculaceae bacterium]|nr:glycoside hydrolase family 92 protein [Muribaculaceae bacterium]
YIQEVRLNGEPYEKSYIEFDQIKNGGTLEFVMGATPSETFGVNSDARP